MRTCVCGHVDDEHALGEPSAPCEVEGCGCFAFEWDGEEEG